MKVASKEYYPYLDLLKFLSCIAIVSIHTKIGAFFPDWLNKIIGEFNNSAVPIFFIVSSFLLWKRINFNSSDIGVIKHFVNRLFVLYVIWTIVLLPTWFVGFVVKHPDDWLFYLPIKLFVWGAPHGSWFIVSLIYGFLTVYVCNRYLGRYISTAIFFIVDFYIRLCFNGSIQDPLGVYYNSAEFSMWLSPFVSLFPLQVGYWLSMYSTSETASKQGWLIVLCVVVLRYINSWGVIDALLQYAFIVLVVRLCLPAVPKEKSHDYTTFRKMSIIIYFTHFVVDICFRELAKRQLISYEGGVREFLFAVVLCSAFAYIVVRLQQRHKWLKYLY